MGISIDDIINIANELKRNQSEIYQRSSVSKSYYAAFHFCLNFANQFRLPDSVKSNFGKHEKLIRRFTEYSGERENELRKVGHYLRLARDNRVDADYALSSEFGIKTAEQNVSYYSLIKDTINNSFTINHS
jgi:uncharacterized protein (UPF0332 family)